jgi:MFS family permease
VFGVASLAGSQADTASALVFWRALMGIGAAMIVPSTLSILVNLFPDRVERRRAIAVWSLMNAVGVLIGPLTGGVLLQHFWWGSVLLVNVPIVAVVLVAGIRLVPSSRDPAAARFDVVGAVLSAAALVILVWAIIEAPTRGWTSPVVLAAAPTAIALGWAFAAYERRTPDPMLDLSVFRSGRLSAAAGAMWIAFLAMSGSMFLSTQSLQLVNGYSALAAAAAISLPLVIVNFVMVPFAPRLIARLGSRTMITGGCALTGCACVLITASGTSSGYVIYLFGFALMALAFSTFVPASTDLIMSAVPATRAGTASAINQMTRQLGQALGVAIAGSIAATGYHARLPSHIPSVPAISVRAASDSLTTALAIAQRLPKQSRVSLLAAARTAFLGGMDSALFVAAAIAVIGSIFAARKIPYDAHLAPSVPSELDEVAPI